MFWSAISKWLVRAKMFLQMRYKKRILVGNCEEGKRSTCKCIGFVHTHLFRQEW